ncbi:LysR family transcriptional regulator [Salmonella enterica subsp. enterica serovar Choleraesuis]|nr:LysR family transcriptional regulator [Salmonella enterica subsp. enterica serovar Choleraesuis]
MNVRALKFFVEVIKRQSINKAAESLFVTQPAISKAIKNLEEELGYLLLIRTRKGVYPTESGKILYHHALSILNEISTLKNKLCDLNNKPSGNIVIGIPSPCIDAFIEPMEKFKEVYPNVALRHIEAGSHSLESMVAHDKLNVAAVILPVSDMKFNVTKIYDDELLLVADKNNPLMSKENLSINDLCNARIVSFSESYKLSELISSLFKKQGKTFEPEVVIDSLDVAFSLISNSSRVALLPELLCQRISENALRFRKFTSGSHCAFSVGIITRKNKTLSREENNWLSLVSDYFECSRL